MTSRQQVICRRSEEEELRWQLVLAGDKSGFEVCQVPGIGRGIKTTRSFQRNDILMRYFGEIVTENEARRRERAGPKVGHFYRFDFHFNEKKYVLDATTDDGSYGRLINHSKKDANVSPKQIDLDGIPARVDIDVGTELRYDYGVRDKEVLEANPWLSE